MQEKVQTLSNEPFAVELPPSPYPGLRPFEKHEWPIFFGRESMTTHVIDRLMDNHFVVVHGDSGCGKSSLIRAGVQAQLEQEQARSGRQWITTDMRPGDSPLWGMTKALARGQDKQVERDFRRLLNRGREAAPALAQALSLTEDQRLCLLVDQFEELFRFAKDTDLEEAQLFTDVLVGLERNPPPGVYIVLTMRSEFLGHCGRFRGLAEAINRSQYLLPRMERPALVRAIGEPARLYGGELGITLAHTLIADASGGQDQLPLIQHGLMRLWNKVRADTRTQVNDPQSERADKTSRENSIRLTITVDDYVKIGGLSKALSNHANEVYNELEQRDKQVAQILFRVLTLRESVRPDLRRPTPFGTVVDIVTTGKPTDNDRKQVKRVVEAFSRPDRSFITPPKGTPLDDPVLLDIGHESLIRHWDRLNQWAKQEAEAADTYRELWGQSRRWQERKKDPWKVLIGSGLLRGRQDLKRVVTWRKQTSAAWATLYGGNYGEVKGFIRASRIFAALKLAFYIALFIFLVGGYFYYQHDTTQREAELNRERLKAAKAQSYYDVALHKESELYASLSLRETGNGYSTAGMILALDALPSDKLERPHVHKAERALYAALHVPHEIMILEGHEKGVEFGAYSPDGKWVVTGSWDKTARIWDPKTGQSMHTLTGHDEAVVHIAFSPNAPYIATSSRDNTARIWDLETGTQIHNLSGHGSAVLHAAFSPDGAHIVTASADRTACIWDVKTGRQIHVLKGHAEAVAQAVFNSNGTQILTASWDGTGRLWDTKTGSQIRVLKGHRGGIRAASFSPNDDYAVTASEDKTARIWDVKTGNQIHVLEEHTDGVLQASFDPNGDRIVTASRDNTVRIWGVETGVEINVLQGHTDAVRHATFSPQGDRVVTASEDKTACLWDAETGEIIYVLRRHGDKLGHALFSPEGDRVVTVSHDKTACIWYTKRNFLRGHKDAVTYAAFSPDSDLIATVSSDNTACLWDVHNRKEIFIMKGHQAPVLHVFFSPQGDHIVTASADKTARIWDAQTGAEIHVLQGHTDEVVHAAFSPQGDHIVTASADKTARIWDAKTGVEIHVLQGHTDEVVHAAFSPQGDRIITASLDGTARIWNAKTGDMFGILSKHKGPVLHAIFSPKGNLIATASKDKIVRLWDPNTGELRRELPGHNDAVLNTAFSPDGSRLITVSRDKTASIWSIEKKEVKSDAQGKTLETQGGVLESLEGVIFNPGSLVLRHDGAVQQAMFSPNGNRIVTASENGIAVIWDVATADRVAILRGHRNKVNTAVFSSNGKLVLSASDDGMVGLWEVFEDPQALVDHAQKIIKDRELTREEYSRIFPY